MLEWRRPPDFARVGEETVIVHDSGAITVPAHIAHEWAKVLRPAMKDAEDAGRHVFTEAAWDAAGALAACALRFEDLSASTTPVDGPSDGRLTSDTVRTVEITIAENAKRTGRARQSVWRSVAKRKSLPGRFDPDRGLYVVTVPEDVA